jgi:DNA-binding NarL/FixJ family response regulator
LKPIRLFIIDKTFEDPEHGYWQAALSAIRECGGIVIVGCSPSLGEALAQQRRPKADVFVIDLANPAPETAKLLDSLSLGSATEIPVIGLCEVVDDAQLAMSIAAGVRACAGRDNPEGLLTAVIEVARGGVPIQRDLASKPALIWSLALDLRRRLREMSAGPAANSADRVVPDRVVDRSESGCPISAREVSILEMVADGFSYREIGETLTIAERTVKNHMARSLEKLGARGRAHAVRMALQAGWICNGPEAGNARMQVAA